jgi:hypothetical protein
VDDFDQCSAMCQPTLMLMEVIVVKDFIQPEDTYLIVRDQYPEGEKMSPISKLRVHTFRSVRK